MLDQYQILLQTKLHRPQTPRSLIDRPQLVAQLEHGIHCPLTLVLASAGFGKTTLVSSWLEHRMAAGEDAKANMPSAWLSLDENDGDLNIFLLYFIAALRTIFADACPETLLLLQARQQPPHSVLFATFSNEIEQLPESFILVLDDFHAIHNMDVAELFNEMAHHWPKPLHLVLISRINPSLPLARLRAKGMLSEFRTRDLRFTAQETAVYLNEHQSFHLSQAALNLLVERIEGWPAGLHLAVLSLRSEDSQEAIISGLYNENSNITDYLVDEVAAHLTPAIQTFLLKTSILDRFCTSLCEALLGKIDTAWNARACLDWIERAELFITPLDDRREWYRYHHLFQELLQRRLAAEISPDQVTNLHRQASAWFEEHGFIDEALHHALAAGDLDLAAHQMISGLREALNREDRPTLERWLQLLPEEIIQRRPELLMIRVWVLEFTWRLDLQVQVLQKVEELLDSELYASMPLDDLQILRGQILALEAQHLYFQNQPKRTIELCQQVLALLPPSWTFVRGAMMLFLGMAMQACGLALEAERLLLADYEAHSDKTDAYAMLILESLGFNYLNAGQLEQSRQIAQVLIQGATTSKIAIMKNWGDYYPGVACYHRNELEAAVQYFTQIVENRYTAQITTYRDAVAGLALIHQIRGESAEAWQMVESISQFDLEQSGSEDMRTRSLRARLMLLQGDLEGAGRWADTIIDLPPDRPLLWLEEPQVTRVRVLVARGTDADLHLALQILDTLDGIVERTHNTRYQLEILALHALVLDTQGDTDQADAMLMQALDLAYLGGFIRVFVDLGKPMYEMLRRIAKQDYSAEMIRRILSSFQEDDKNLPGSASPEQPRRQPSLANSTLDEPLTQREIEILSLLRGPLSIKEIADGLNISYATARRHTINIYAKLSVNQRWKAVAKAEELNLLPSR